VHRQRITGGDPREIPFRLECLERGGYLLGCAEKLLLQLIYDWPRRDRSMLLTGCGAGLFLETMHTAGFEVAAQDSHPHFVTRARLKLGHAVELHLGGSDHLRFADNAFDYVTILFSLNLTREPDAVLREAYRVGKKGILIGVLNRCPTPTAEEASRLGLVSGRAALRPLSWSRLRKILGRWIPYREIQVRSVLPGPQSTWKDAVWANCLNRPCYPVDWGAFYAVRADLQSECGELPLRALSTKPGMI